VDGDWEAAHQPLPKAALYVFVDKAQMKGIKVDSHPKADFIPVDYPEPRRLKTSFKKLLRACHPSSVPQVGEASGRCHLNCFQKPNFPLQFAFDPWG
jgi:myotubularin-related protein 5/13